MEPEGSLLCSLQSATDHSLTPDASNPHLQPYFPKIHSDIFPSKPRSSQL